MNKIILHGSSSLHCFLCQSELIICGCFVDFSLEFGTAPATEPGAPPIFTNDILAMISPEKETVPLLKVTMILLLVTVSYYYDNSSK